VRPSLQQETGREASNCLTQISRFGTVLELGSYELEKHGTMAKQRFLALKPTLPGHSSREATHFSSRSKAWKARDAEDRAVLVL
jgi:hypothetical protein